MVIKKIPTCELEVLQWLYDERAVVKFERDKVIVSTDWGDLPPGSSWFTTTGKTLLEAIEKQYDYNNTKILYPYPVGLQSKINHDHCEPRSSMRHPLDMG